METDGRKAHKSHPPLLHWDVIAAVSGLSVGYALVDDSLRVGPRWLLGAVMFVLLTGILTTKRLEMHGGTKWLSYATASSGLLVVAISVVTLCYQVIESKVGAKNLLADAALLWSANVLVFSYWYWEFDGRGPRARHMDGYEPTDLLFPQNQQGGKLAEGWCPDYIDYLFVAFTASSAFSPTDTLTLSRRVKALMMAQGLISIVLLAVLAARAINTLN